MKKKCNRAVNCGWRLYCLVNVARNCYNMSISSRAIGIYFMQ